MYKFVKNLGRSRFVILLELNYFILYFSAQFKSVFENVIRVNIRISVRFLFFHIDCRGFPLRYVTLPTLALFHRFRS